MAQHGVADLYLRDSQRLERMSRISLRLRNSVGVQAGLWAAVIAFSLLLAEFWTNSKHFNGLPASDYRLIHTWSSSVLLPRRR